MTYDKSRVRIAIRDIRKLLTMDVEGNLYTGTDDDLNTIYYKLSFIKKLKGKYANVTPEERDHSIDDINDTIKKEEGKLERVGKKIRKKDYCFPFGLISEMMRGEAYQRYERLAIWIETLEDFGSYLRVHKELSPKECLANYEDKLRDKIKELLDDEDDTRRVLRGKKPKNRLEENLVLILIIASLASGLILSSPGITGFSTSNFNQNIVNPIGAMLFIFGLILAFFYFRKDLFK